MGVMYYSLPLCFLITTYQIRFLFLFLLFSSVLLGQKKEFDFKWDAQNEIRHLENENKRLNKIIDKF